MSDEKFENLPQNKNDLEYNKYGLGGDGKVGVRVVGATTNSDGLEVTDTLLKEVQRMMVVMESMAESLEIAVNHLRAITELNREKGDKY